MSKKNFFASIFHSELGSRILTVVAVISVLAIAIILSGPKPVDYSDAASTPTEVVSQNNQDMATNLAVLINEPPITSGVIVGTTAVLAIIFIGTLLEMRRNP